MDTDSTAVLVVGGGLVGLSAAVFLAWRGVPTVLVEKHPASSPHPRAVGYTPRTMELYRAVGLGPRIPQRPRGGADRPRRIRVDSLAGAWHEETLWTPDAAPTPSIEYSPCTNAGIAQDRLEPILRDRAVELGADIRMSTTLAGFEQDADGVSATLRDPEGNTHTLRAAYLIAADGHRSPIREALGIGRAGKGYLRTMRSVLFRPAFDEALRARLDDALEAGVRQFSIDAPDFQAMCGTYGDGRWLLLFEDDVERDAATLQALVRRAVGRAALDAEIIATGRWDIAGLIADRFASGRVFLAGDAAHMLPPNRGGYGANTGIADAHNLAWKLAAVVAGASAPALLDTYDAERRPVAWLRHDQIFARPEHAAYAGGAGDTPILDDDAIEFGQRYRSTAVFDADAVLPNDIAAGDDLPPALRPDEWAGRPGTRAPHLWVTEGGVLGDVVSTLDLFQREWVLLAADARWGAAGEVGEALGIALRCVVVGVDVQPSDVDAFRAAFGLGPGGASLIRPDGYVAWRATDLPADPAGALTAALRGVSSAERSAPVLVGA